MYSIKFIVILKLVPSRPFRAQCGKSVVITHSAVFGAHLLLIEYKRETSRGIPGAFRCSRVEMGQYYDASMYRNT